ncbi:MAG: hypothetical protein ACREPP_01065, partial [Rhodanobacteraceae bacterium]
DGTITSFDPKGSKSTLGRAINAQGTVVGSFEDSGGADHGFVRAPDGTIAPVDIPGAMSIEVEGINKKGVIVGDYTDSGYMLHGFVLSP